MAVAGSSQWMAQLVANLGQAAPGLSRQYTALDRPIINARDEVAFFGFAASPAPGGFPVITLGRAEADGLHTAASTGTFVAPLGGAIAPVTPLAFNANGTLAFHAAVPGVGWVLLVQSASGRLTKVYTEGDPVPGIPGATFVGPTGARPGGGLSLNVLDDVAFAALYADSGGTNPGVFLQPHDGPLEPILLAGAVLPDTGGGIVCPGAVPGISDVWVNNHRDVAFRVTSLCNVRLEEVVSSAVVIQLAGRNSLVRMPGSIPRLDAAAAPLSGAIVGLTMSSRAFRGWGGAPTWAAIIDVDTGEGTVQAVITQRLGDAAVVRARAFDAAPGTQGQFSRFHSAQLGSRHGRVAIAADISGDPATASGIFFSDRDGSLEAVALMPPSGVRVTGTPIITTFAGNGSFSLSGDGGPASSAQLRGPNRAQFDAAGNLFIADYLAVRRVDANTGIITTVAGNGTQGYSGDGGPATAAEFVQLEDVVPDAAGNLYLCDLYAYVVRRVDAATRIITTVAGNGSFGYSGDGGPATAAQLAGPEGIAVDAAGNIYVAQGATGGGIRRVDAVTGIITTWVGGGQSSPQGCRFDRAGTLYIVDWGAGRILRVDPTTRSLTTVAGNGTFTFNGDGMPATQTELGSPSDICFDAAGNLYICEYYNSRILRVDAVSGIATTYAGNGQWAYSGDGGPAPAAALGNPRGVTIDSAGNLYIADTGNARIRKVTAPVSIVAEQPLAISTIAGTGSRGYTGDGGAATAAQVGVPIHAVADAEGNLFISDGAIAFESGHGGVVRRVAAATGAITTVVGTGAILSTVPGTGTIGSTGDGGPATAAVVMLPAGVAFDRQGNLFFADFYADVVRRVDVATGIISTVAGNGTRGHSGDGGPATAAQLTAPFGVALDAAGNLLFSEPGSGALRRVDARTGVITTLATPANQPAGIALDAAGNLYAALFTSGSVVRLDVRTGVITLVAGTGNPGFAGDGGPATQAMLSEPTAVALDGAGSLYISDAGNGRIRRVDFSTGLIATVVGSGVQGFSGDGGAATAAEVSFPYGLALDVRGNLLIADTGNARVRKVTIPSFPDETSINSQGNVVFLKPSSGLFRATRPA